MAAGCSTQSPSRKVCAPGPSFLMRITCARNCPPVASEIPRSRYSMKLRRPVLYVASCARLTLKVCLLSLIDGSSVGSAAHHLTRLDVQVIAPRPERLHRLEAILDHVAVELHAVAVGIGKVNAPGHVVGDGGVDLNAQLSKLPVGRLQLREASELPGHVVEPRLALCGRLARGQLEERQVVMLLAHAQEHRAPFLLVGGDLEAEHPRVELLGLLHVAHLEDHVAELASLDHPCLPRALAALRRSSRSLVAGPQYRRWRGRVVYHHAAPNWRAHPCLARNRVLAYRP